MKVSPGYNGERHRDFFKFKMKDAWMTFWIEEIEPTEFNVIPMDDLRKHELSGDCECNPKIVEESGQLIIVHNSYDKREIVERLYETCKN